MAGLFSQTIPPREDPLVEDSGIIVPPTWGGHRGLVVCVFDWGPIGQRFGSALCQAL